MNKLNKGRSATSINPTKKSFAKTTHSAKSRDFNRSSLFKKIYSNTKSVVGNGLKKSDKKKNIYLLIFKRFAIAFTFVLLVGILAGTIVAAFWVSNVSKSLAAINVDQSFETANTGGDTYVYAADGTTLLTSLSGDQTKDYISIDKVPDYVKASFIAAENKTFYEDKGIDIASLARAGFSIIQKKGELSQGASTITQQVVKNLILKDQSKSADRKMKELILSVQIAQKYKKDDILQFYINSISFGSNVIGIKRASEKYFSKEPDQLSYAEAALLAGIPNDPNRLAPPGFTLAGVDPYDTLPDGTKILSNIAREKEILTRMNEVADTLNATPNENYHLDKQKIKDANNEVIKYNFQQSSSKAPHFTQKNGVVYTEVKNILKSMDAYKNKTDDEMDTLIQSGGFRIYTTLNIDIQNKAQAQASKVNDNTESVYKICNYCGQNTRAGTFGASNMAVISVDPKTGSVLAYVGSRDFNTSDADGKMDGQQDIINSGLGVSQGSSMKPFNYLNTFLQAPGTGPTTTWADFEPLDMGGGYKPKNFSIGDPGGLAVSSAFALDDSLNKPAVQSLITGGVDNYATLLGKMGYSPATVQRVKDVGVAATLGSAVVRPWEHAQAYQTLVNEGVRHNLFTVTKIADKDGKVLFQHTNDAGTKVVDEKYTWLILNILRGYPTVRTVRTATYDAAGKTGTNDFGPNGLPTSNVFWGFTPDLLTGMWIGNSNNTPLKTYSVGEKLGQVFWTPYMLDILPKFPKTTFVRPSGIVERTVCRDTGFLAPAGQNCDDPIGGIGGTVTGQFVDGKLPKVDTNHVKLRVTNCNGTIKLASKADELAGLASDGTFVKFETPTGSAIIQRQIDDYATSHGSPPPPTETCNIPRTADNSIFTKITSPPDGTQYNGGDIVPITIDSANTITDAKYYFDNSLVVDVTTAPFSAQYTLPVTIASGPHAIKVVTTDDHSQTGQVGITINVKSNLDPAVAIQITSPQAGASVPPGKVSITSTLTDPNNVIKTITVYGKKSTDANYTTIGTYPKSGSSYTSVWDLTTMTPGQYQVYEQISDGTNTKNSNVITFNYL